MSEKQTILIIEDDRAISNFISRALATNEYRTISAFTGKEGLSRLLNSREGGGLSGLLKTLRLDSLDAGDILLLLIILYLLVEGDDLDLVIALGAVLLMGLGES